MKKLQQFFVLSFQSNRIKKSGKIICSLNDARKNQEVISVGDSQLFRTLRSISHHPYDEIKLSELWNGRSRLRKNKNKKENIIEISKITSLIDEMLFIRPIISITFNHVSHYKKLVKEGVYVNGKRFIRFLGAAGQLRRNTVLFIDEDYLDKVRNVLECGFDKNTPVNFGKFNAYYSLVSGSSHPVRTPRYLVVPDLEITQKREVNFVEDDNETVNRKTLPITLNIFDGAGMVSTDFAKLWSEDLGLDYDACSFIFRAPWMKGLLTSFPFRIFAKENNITAITDIYGKQHEVEDVDVILTKSQFKLWEGYSSTSEHLNKCLENNLTWNITRVNPKREKDSFFSSYMYLQVLKDSADIEKLCKPTLDYFNEISLLDAEKTLLYLMGTSVDEEGVEFLKIENPIVKALCLNRDCIQDPHIRRSIIKSLNRKIHDSYSGKLLMSPANYQFAIPDLVSLSQHSLGLKVTGLLREKEVYSEYWNNKDVKTIIGGRSPLTYRSELVKLNTVKGKNFYKWFGHIYSGIILNSFDDCVMLFGDSD